MASRANGAENGKLPFHIMRGDVVSRTIWLDDPREAVCAAFNADAAEGVRAEYQPVSAAMLLANSSRRSE
jgi:hypothetical protein